MWPPAEAPPEAPRPGPPSDPDFGHPFTPEDKVYVVEFTRWAGRRVPDIELPLLSAALEQFAPHHSRAKWFGHMSKYSNQYAKRVPNELAHLFLDMSSDEDDDEVPQDKRLRRAEDSDASGSGTPAEPSSKITAPATGQKATPRGGRGGVVLPYTDEELDSMAKLLAQNHNRSLNSLFTEFAASRVGAGLQPQRKGSSYAQYARTHGEWLKTRGRSLLGLPASRNTSKGVGTRGRFDEEVAFEDPWNSDGDVESDDNHDSTPLQAIEEETGRKKRGPLVPYTEEELDSMAKLAVENPDTPVGALFSEFAASRLALGLHPQRKAHTYTEYYRRHSETLNQRGYLLLQKERQSPEKRPERRSTSSTVSPKKPPTPVDDTFSDLPADDARLGQPYTEDDYNAMTDFLARHPALFRNSEEGKSTTKQTLWQKFDQEYPGRSPKAWREFFRKRADRLEQDALALIEEYQTSSKARSSQDAQQPDAVFPVTESTPDVPTLKSQPSGSSATLNSTNSIDATTSTLVVSPLSPRQSPVGTKRALSADLAAESSAPAAKKLKERLVD
ncbi:hypothetical protein FS837_006101 [Tulasnella sp. UAMH 9824]|nr:hypothetical protein FS837_006101 [Tulasnella sp. UAMH 9824]